MPMIQLVKLSLPARTVLTAIVDGTYTPGDGDQSLRAAARTWKVLAAHGFVKMASTPYSATLDTAVPVATEMGVAWVREDQRVALVRALWARTHSDYRSKRTDTHHPSILVASKRGTVLVPLADQPIGVLRKIETDRWIDVD